MTSRRARWLLCAALLGLGGCSTPIAGGLDEGDANRVVVALESHGIGADKEADAQNEGRYRVLVSHEDAASAAQVLSQENLPPPRTPGVLDALGESSLVPSRTSEHAKLVAGTAGDLERSLRSVDGILGVRVHLAVPSRTPFEGGDQPEKSSASVLIRHRGATAPLATKEVQNLVAGAVPGMLPDQVSVVMVPSPVSDRLPQRELSRLGPITVTRGSVGALRWAVAAVVLTNLTLIGLLVALWAKVRRTQAALDDTRAAAAPQAR
jgi:type III secretion protein J